MIGCPRVIESTLSFHPIASLFFFLFFLVEFIQQAFGVRECWSPKPGRAPASLRSAGSISWSLSATASPITPVKPTASPKYILVRAGKSGKLLSWELYFNLENRLRGVHTSVRLPECPGIAGTNWRHWLGNCNWVARQTIRQRVESDAFQVSRWVLHWEIFRIWIWDLLNAREQRRFQKNTSHVHIEHVNTRVLTLSTYAESKPPWIIDYRLGESPIPIYKLPLATLLPTLPIILIMEVGPWKRLRSLIYPKVLLRYAKGSFIPNYPDCFDCSVDTDEKSLHPIIERSAILGFTMKKLTLRGIYAIIKGKWPRSAPSWWTPGPRVLVPDSLRWHRTVFDVICSLTHY